MEADDISDLFGAFGPVVVRAMFGGQGIYADGLMFALQARGILYLKADEAFAQALAARGSAPFSYQTDKGTRTIGGYWRVPDAAMDDADDLAALARQALAIARAAAAARPKKAAKNAAPKSAPSKSVPSKNAASKNAASKNAASKSAGPRRVAPTEDHGKPAAVKEEPAGARAKVAPARAPKCKAEGAPETPPKTVLLEMVPTNTAPAKPRGGPKRA